MRRDAEATVGTPTTRRRDTRERRLSPERRRNILADVLAEGALVLRRDVTERARRDDAADISLSALLR